MHKDYAVSVPRKRPLQINNAPKLHIESQSNRTNFRPLKNFPLLPLAFKINSGNSPKTRCMRWIQENWYGYGILNSQISLSIYRVVQRNSARSEGPIEPRSIP